MTSDIQPIDMVKQENPLLVRLSKLPGSTIRLPSKGIFYKNGELDSEVIDGEVVVFQMTATDDIMLKSPDMLFQGTAIEAVIRRCIPQIKKPMELLIGDVDYILTQMRRLSYGSHIPMEYSCSCAKDEAEAKRRRASGDDTHMIPLDTFIQSSKELSVSDFNKKYKLTTGSGQTVVLRPIRYGDFVKIQQMNDADKLVSAEEIEVFLATNCTAFTQSVDGIDDSKLIFEWYLKLPRSDYELIKKKLNNVGEWGISFKYTVTCKFCNKSEELTTQLNPLYFFMLPSSQETNTK